MDRLFLYGMTGWLVGKMAGEKEYCAGIHELVGFVT